MGNKISILMLASGINGGGVGKIIYTYSKYLDKNIFSLDVASLDTEDGTLPFCYKDLCMTCHSVFLLDRHNYINRIKQWCSILKSRKYDIVHVHMEEVSAIYLLFAYFYGVKVRISQSHISKIPSFFSATNLKRAFLPLLYLVTTHKYACGIDAGRRLWGNKDFFILVNAIETEKFSFSVEKRNAIRKKLNINKDIKVVGTVGRFHNQKNPYFIVDIIEKLYKKEKNIVFLWAGDGSMKPEIAAEIKKRGLSKIVFLLGNRSDIPDLLMAMDVFILPSLYEGLPIVGVEAQVSGLPTILSDTITREVCINSKCIYLNIDSSELWAQTISTALCKYSSDSRSDNNISDSIYNITNAIKKLEKEYLSFVNNS